MALNALHVHDLQLFVTEQSAAVADVRPTVATETDATVTNPSNAVDADPASYAELTDAAATAVLTLTVFTNPAEVSDAGRDWVELSLTGAWGGTPAGDDSVEVEYRGADTESWTSLDTATGGTEWTGAERTWTVTTEAGEYAEAGWQARVTYTRGTGGTGTFRVYDCRVEIGGDVVAPTATEIQEDVAALSASKFGEWWTTITASVDAALTDFGSLAVDRAAVLNAVRDRASAPDAYSTLTNDAARADAEAWEDVGKAAAFPRYTGPNP